MKIFMNATLFDVQNVGNCISEDLDFKILGGIMPPAPPRLKGLLRRPFCKQAYVAYWKFSEIPVSKHLKSQAFVCKKTLTVCKL